MRTDDRPLLASFPGIELTLREKPFRFVRVGLFTLEVGDAGRERLQTLTPVLVSLVVARREDRPCDNLQ